MSSGLERRHRTPTPLLAGRTARPPGFRHEALAALAVVVAGALVVAWWSRNLWFLTDVWDHLAMRRLGDLGDLLRPHRGHWQLSTTLQTQALHQVFGMDYWPWYHLPRAVAWGAFSMLFWWYLRRRGARALPALGALAAINFLSTSAFFASPHIGTPISLSCFIGAALLIEERPEPSWGHRLAVAAMLTWAVASSTLGAVVVAGVGLLAVLEGTLRKWWPPIAAASLIYAAWFLSQAGLLFGSDYATVRRGVPELPLAVVISLNEFVSDLTRLPPNATWVLLAGGTAWLATLLVRRRLTPFDIAAVTVAALYLAGSALVRQSLSRGNVSMNVTPLVLLVVVPHLGPFRRRWAAASAAAVFGALLACNAVGLRSSLADRTAWAQSIRPVVERMATLIDEGEPYLGSLQIYDLVSSTQLDLDGLASLVADGWVPERPVTQTAAEELTDRTIEDDATVRLKASFYGSAEGSVKPRVVDGTMDRGCVTNEAGASVRLAVAAPTEIRVSVESAADRDSWLVVAWTDEGGTAVASLEWRALSGRARRLLLLGGDGIEVELRAAPAGTVRVCGVDRHRPGG